MRIGVSYLEVFSPIVNGLGGSDLGLIVNYRNSIARELDHPTYVFAHCRCKQQDVEAALRDNPDGLNLYLRTSDPSRGIEQGRKIEDVVKIARPLLDEIRRNYPNQILRFSAEDAFRTKPADLFAVYDPIYELVDRLGFPDTVGTATPSQVAERIHLLEERYPKVAFEGHFHNDRGLSLINAVTAVKAGLEYIQTSVLGLGERSGITSMSALLLNLYLEDPKLLESLLLNLSGTYPLNVLVADIFRMQVPPTEPVSLTNRTHQAGVHANAILNDPGKYEAHPLAKFGVSESRLLIGPFSGWNIIRYFLTNILHYHEVSEEQAKAIAGRLKERAHELSERKSPADLLMDIADEMAIPQLTHPRVPEPLINFKD